MILRSLNVEIDDERRQIRRDGESCPVEPRVFDLILYLARNQARVVSKDELLEALWSEKDVFEAALSVCIHRARSVLGGREGGREFIQTVPRCGYRFIAPLEARPAPIPALRPSPLAATIRVELVGREKERSHLSKTLERTRWGRSNLVLVQGEPGIGKTRLLEEAVDIARSADFEVLWADASPHDSNSVTSPWRSLLMAAAASRSDEELRVLMGASAGTIAAIVPRLADRLRSTSGVAPAQEPDPRSWLAAVVGVISQIASAKPLLVVLDDIQHHNDALSLLEGIFDAPSLPLIVLAASREVRYLDALRSADWVDRLDRKRRVTRIALAAMEDAQVLRLIDQLAGGPVPEVVHAGIVARAGGNPLFVQNYWRHLVMQGLVALTGDGWVSRGDPTAIDLPGGVRSVIASRCASLSLGARALLSRAALFGRVFTLEELTQAAGAPPTVVRHALKESVHGNLLKECGDADTYSFTHASIAEVLQETTPEHERRSYHRQIARAFEHLYQTDIDSYLSDLAHHYLCGVDRECAGRALDYAQRLANQQVSVLEFRNAALWFQHAIGLIDTYHPELTARRYNLLLGVGDALLHAGDEPSARRALREAATRARGTTEAHLEQLDDAPHDDDPVEGDRLLAFIRGALAVVGDEQAEVAWRQEIADRQRAVRDLTVKARQNGHPRQLASALVNLRWLASVRDRPHEHLLLSTEAVLIAEQLDSAHLLQEARLLRIHDLLEHGRIAEADVEITAFADLASTLGTRVHSWVAAYLRAMRAHLDGRLADAEQLAQQAVQTADVSVADVAWAFFTTQLVGQRASQGRMSELLGLLEAFATQFPKQPIGHANLTSVYCELGRLEDARTTFKRALETSSQAGAFGPSLVSHVAAGLARPCVLLREATVAAELFELLEPRRGTFLVVAPAVACIGPTDGYLALLAEAAGRWRTALRLYETAIEASDRSGNRAFAAHVRYELARALLSRGRAGCGRARTLLEAAAETARDLDLGGLLHWVETLAPSAFPA